MFRAYSAERRDRAPLIETEDFRDEAARRFWDDYSPPHFGFKPGPNDTYHWNSRNILPRRRRALQCLLDPTASPTPIPPTPSGPAMPRSTSPTPTPTAGRTPAKSPASAERWMRVPLAQGSLLRLPSDAKSRARHPHHRPLDVSREYHQKNVRRQPTPPPSNFSSTASPSAK